MRPRIHGLTVCVDYAHLFQFSGQQWMRGLASLMVVTTPHDLKTHATLRLLEQTPAARDCQLRVFCTDAFTRDGAAFNKGLAMEEARAVMPWEDWILFFDVDIIPDVNWADSLPELQMGYLYGAWRYQFDQYTSLTNLDRVDDDCVGYGYFQLFHSKDPKVQKKPLLDTHWRHAGNYDSNFLLSFRSMVQELPLNLYHIGPQHENWFGVGRKDEFTRMQAARNGLGIQDSEKIDAD